MTLAEKSPAEILMEFGDLMNPFYEFIAGQKKELEEKGFSSHIAERMCVDLFQHTLWLIRGCKST